MCDHDMSGNAVVSFESQVMSSRTWNRPLRRAAPGIVVPSLMALGTIALAAQLSLRPGFNLFSIAQDLQLGRDNAALVEKQIPLLGDDVATRYLNQLGRRLSGYAPYNQAEYVWQFRVLNSGDINAFALPGGYIYVNRATLEFAEDEAQLAGVLAHEEGHVVLRHGTHQLSETLLAEKPLEMLSGLIGEDDSFTSKLLQFGIGLGAQSILLHNSRGMEAQADTEGAYILYRAGYDPRALARFFELVEHKYPQQTLQFLSDHPSPGNRVKAVEDEIPELGPAKTWSSGSPEFRSVKSHLLALPRPPEPKAPAADRASG
jgi:beta-barrel assembly-enhancing protease